MNPPRFFNLLACALLMVFACLGTGCRRQNGIVLDAQSNQPVPNATIFHNGRMTLTSPDGKFVLWGVDDKQPILVKSSGYKRTTASLQPNSDCRISLEPFDAKGVYLSYYGVSSQIVRQRVLDLVESTELNAIVVDVKEDRGLMSFRWNIPLAEQTGAMARPTIPDVKAFLEDMHKRGIYVIARIAVFKDALLAEKKPEWAILNTQTGKPFAEPDKVAWMDPFREEVWDYAIAIARGAAEAGFDEIQFDYVRFPTGLKGGSIVKLSRSYTPKNRAKAINTFLERAYRELLPFNTYVAADLFGVTCWFDNECGIGQPMRQLAKTTDYLCPMIYPSGFKGVLGSRVNSAAIPQEVVSDSMRSAILYVGGNSKKLRPWLQNFKDYAFDKREYTEREIALQILASNESNTSGWMLWDASNKYNYTTDALKFFEGDGPINIPQAASTPITEDKP